MKKFKNNIYLHLINLMIVLFGSVVFVQFIRLKEGIFITVAWSITVAVVAFSSLYGCFTMVVVDSECIYCKTLFKRVTIPFNKIISINEITSIREDPYFWVYFQAAIRSDNKVIRITSWYINYKELLQLVIDKCDKEKVSIDQVVFEKIRSR